MHQDEEREEHLMKKLLNKKNLYIKHLHQEDNKLTLKQKLGLEKTLGLVVIQQ